MKKTKNTSPVSYDDEWYDGMAQEWSDYGYEDYDPLFHLDLTAITSVSETTAYVDTIASFIGFSINLIHLLFLFQKELRNSFIFVIMIGVSVSDILVFSRSIVEFLLTWDPLELLEPTCFGLPYYNILTRVIVGGLEELSRQSSAFLALCMAAFRSLSVSFPMSSSVQSLMKPRAGLLTVLAVFSLCTAWTVFARRKTRIRKADSCGEISIPTSYVRYDITSTANGVDPLNSAINGYFAVFISVLHVTVTIPLIIELRKARERRRNLRSEKSDSTTKFVMATSVLFFLSELIYGLVTVSIEQLLNSYTNLQVVLILFRDVPTTFLTVNSTLHVFICFFMSTQYRDVVKRICLPNDQTPSSMVFVEPATTSSVRTLKTSRDQTSSTSRF